MQRPQNEKKLLEAQKPKGQSDQKMMNVWMQGRAMLKNFFFKFIHFERDRDSASEEGAERQEEQENPKQDPRCQHRAWWGSQTQETEITTWAKTKHQTLTDWVTQVPQEF